MVIDEEVSQSDLSERVSHLKIFIRIKSGCDERDMWPFGNRNSNMHRTGMTGRPMMGEVTCAWNGEAVEVAQKDACDGIHQS